MTEERFDEEERFEDSLHSAVADYLRELGLKVEKLYNKIIDLIPASLDSKESIRSAVDEALKSIKAIDVTVIPEKLKESIREYAKSKVIYDDRQFDKIIGKLSVHALLSPKDMTAEIRVAILDMRDVVVDPVVVEET